MASHFQILTTTIKLQEIQFTRSPAFFVLINENNFIINSALLDFVFSHISDINASISSSFAVTPDEYYPPFLDIHLTLDSHHIYLWKQVAVVPVFRKGKKVKNSVALARK
jgi:hypothetical protein